MNGYEPPDRWLLPPWRLVPLLNLFNASNLVEVIFVHPDGFGLFRLMMIRVYKLPQQFNTLFCHWSVKQK